MAVQPRIVFRRFSPDEPATRQPWMDHLARVLGPNTATGLNSSEDLTVWQLISANNRELARSAKVYPGFAAARASARESIQGLADMVVHLVVDEQKGLQGWFVSRFEVPVMVSARWYFADRERGQAVTLALAALSTAQLAEGTRIPQDRALQPGDIRVR